MVELCHERFDQRLKEHFRYGHQESEHRLHKMLQVNTRRSDRRHPCRRVLATGLSRFRRH